MRTWAKRLVIAGSAALVTLAIAAAVFLLRPEMLLTSRTVGRAVKILGESYSPRWSSLRFSADAFENRRHRYVLRAADFCVDDRAGVLSACFSELELSAVVFYSRRGPVVERVERLVAVSKSAALDMRNRDPEIEKRVLPFALRSTSIEALRVELSSFTATSAKTAVTGSLKAVLAPDGRRPLSVAADARIRGPEGDRRLKAELVADTDLLKGGKPTYMDVVGRADMGVLGRARVAFRLRREARRYAVTGGAEVFASTGPLRSVRLADCRGEASLRFGAARPSGAELVCRYSLRIAAPPSLKTATGRVTLSAGLDGQRYEAAAKANLDPITSWGVLSGDLAVRAGGSLDRPLKDASLSHELRASAQVPRFGELVAALRDTKYSVPAPVHVLKGPLLLALESRGDTRAPRQIVHYAFSSDLAGPRQRLILRAKGGVTAVNALTPGRSFEHAGELILKEVALELPRLDIGRTPKVFSDKRIKSASTAARRPLPLRGSLVLKTEKPLILFSNLAKEPVPIALDLVAVFPPASAAGTVGVRRFNVELFRRNATIDHLNVTLSSGSKVGGLEGLVRYKTPNVEIRILILGTTEKPRIEFTSVPPMKREDIIALLIFGKSPDELDPEQTASVSNTETALESRAFGLASLYLFGATPIEHVGYDPATKTTMVKLRLPGGANLTFGSDFDLSRQLTVRKPLAPHWAIQTEFTDQGQQSNAATTFLEWFNRY